MSFPKPFYRWRPHPWHGLSVGPQPPRVVHAYIEITTYDSVKYEVDKETGYLRVDRPQRFSSQPPALYGFIPRTYCGTRVGQLSPKSQRGDGDPMDICVLSERSISRAEVLLNARVIGGLRMIDDNEADDKVIAVLENDSFWSDIEHFSQLPDVLIDRLRHYFLTYKSVPGQEAAKVALDGIYDADEAQRVVQAAMLDYVDEFGD
ncbi:inorganic pyrophosphatase [Myxococcota bacterium]|jgi:inorganic pyrophosphatase|nr:inorganic pyrophosphatase [Myxococcota bacterium]